MSLRGTMCTARPDGSCMVQASQMLDSSALPFHLNLPQGRASLSSYGKRDHHSNLGLTPWCNGARSFISSDDSCGYVNTLSLSSTATAHANKSDTNHTFFRTEET